MEKVVRLLNLTLIAVIAGCAGQIPPSGGPVDKTPPKIIYTSPSQKGLNFHFQKIILTFDKYMSEMDVDNAVYFPPFKAKDMSLDWSGKDLTVTLHKPFEQDRTYILTIGAGAKDLRENHLAGAFNLVFSTGALIDTGTVSGKIFSDKAQPYTVAAFPVTANIDTLNPSRNIAKYVTQSDDSGTYVMQGLADGKYRLICFDDQMKDFTYARQTDAYSSATHDVDISGEIQDVKVIDFIPSIEDTSRPQLYGADLAKGGSLILKFSEVIDSESIAPARFMIRDSASGQVYPIEYAVRLEENEYDVALGMKKPLALKRKYYVEVSDSVKDLQDNPMSAQNNPAVVEIDSATANLAQYYFNFPDSLHNVTVYDTLFCQIVSKSIYGDSSAVEVSLVDSAGNNVPGSIVHGPATIFNVLPAKLNTLSWYGLKIKYPRSSLDTVGKGSPSSSGGVDSVVVRYFKMIDFSSLGDIEGNISP
ncbi:MAG: Ig-like domain-containing protein, partial [Candidatus Kryptoniota bacterium]